MAKETKPQTGKAKAANAPKEPKPTQALIEVKHGALSVDVGPVVVAALSKTYDDEQRANDLLNQVRGKRYDLLSNTTLAIAKAYKADTGINAAHAFSADRKDVQKLNDQLLIALGIREYADVKGKKKLVYSKAVSKYFPGPKDNKDDQATIRKATLRSNVIHMIKKCAQAAVTIHEQGVTARMDADAGTLKISGPAVEKKFGQAEVLLNEKQTITNGKDTVQLKDRPSFQALANMSAGEHGAAIKTGSSDRTQKVITNPDEAIEQMVKSLTAALSKLEKGKLSDRQRVALTSLQSAIAAKL